VSSARILVIEDNARIGGKLVEILERSGFEAYLETDGRAGLDRFAVDRPDLVLVEHLVPGVEGGRAVDKLRAVDDEVPVVVMATSPRAQTRLLQRGQGFIQGFLLKPFRVPDLVMAIEQALSERDPPAPEGGAIARDGVLADGVAPLLFELVREGAAGVLRLSRDGVFRAIYLLNGLPVFAESNLLSETFGRYLLQRGTIHKAQYRAVQRHMVEHGVRQGEALVELGILDDHELYALLRGQVRERVVRCFDWPGASYEFYPDNGFIDDKLMFPMNPLALLVEGVTRRLTKDALLDWFVSHREATLEPTVLCDELGAYIDRLQREPQITELLVERPTCAELAQQLRLTDVRAGAIVRALAELGCVRVGADALGPEDTGGPLTSEPTSPAGRAERVALEDPRYLDPDDAPAADDVARSVFARYMATRGGDHFTVLGLSADADSATIEDAWLTVSRDYHPDRFAQHPDAEVRERAKEVFIRAGLAFGVLGDPDRREPYRAEVVERRVEAAARARLEAEAEFARGEKLLVRSDASGARRAFERAHSLARDEPLYEVHLGWATFLAAEDDEDRASGERILRRGIDRDAAQAVGYDLLSQLCERTGRGADAAEMADRANHLAAQTSGVS
jgi:CheY-like chemotaxis protein